MADPVSAGFGSPYPVLVPQPTALPPQSRGMVPPRPTGPNGMMGYVEAPVAGAYEAASTLGSAAQAAGKLVGANDFAKAAADWAARQRATAATYQSPNLENSEWYDPRGIAYRVLKGAPAAAGMLGAGAITAAAAPEGALGLGAAGLGGLVAGAAGYPLAVGGNVQTSEAANGPLTTGEAAKAALLGVPEAAVGAYPFARISGMIARGVEGSTLRAATHQAASQALAGVGQDLIAQQMGDPNRPIQDRMHEMISSALTGGVTGAIMGAGVHALTPLRASAKINPSNMTTQDLTAPVDAVLRPPTEGGMQEELPIESPVNSERPYQHAPQGRLDQLHQYFQGIENPDMFQQRTAADIANEQVIRKQLNLQINLRGPEPAAPPSEQVIPQPSQEQADLVTRLAQDRPIAEQGLTPAELDTLPNFGRQESVAEPAATIPAPVESIAPPRAPEAVLADVLSATRMKKPPVWLKDTSSDEAVKQQVREQAGPQTEDSPPLKGAVKNIADKFGMLDEKGKLIPEKVSPPVETPTQTEIAPIAKTNVIPNTNPTIVPSNPLVAKAHASLTDLQSMTDVAKPSVSANTATATNKLWQDSLKADPTGQTLWEEHGDKLSPEAQTVLQSHMENVQDVKQAGLLYSKMSDATAPQTQQDVDIAHTVQGGGSLKNVLPLIQRNGSTGLNKIVANMLMQHGVDASMELTPREGWQPTEGETERPSPEARGVYEDTGNRIGLFQNTGLEQLTLHEGVHAATSRAIEANTPAGKEMTRLYDRVKDASPGNDAYGLESVHEFTAEAFSNPDFQDFLRTHPADDAPNMWQAFKNAVAKVFGATGTKRTALDQVIETGSRLMKENQTASAPSELLYSKMTPQGMEKPIKSLFGLADKYQEIKDAIPGKITGQSSAWQKFTNGWHKDNWIRDVWGGNGDATDAATGKSKGITDNVAYRDQRDLFNETNHKVMLPAVKLLGKLSPEEIKGINEVVQASHIDLDVRGKFSEANAKRENAADLLERHNAGARIWGKLSPEAKEAYNSMVDGNRGQAHQFFAQSLHAILAADHADKVTLPYDPSEDYHYNQPKLQDNTHSYEQYWNGEYDRLAKVGQGRIDDMSTELLKAKDNLKTVTKGEETDKVKTQIAGLNKKIGELKSLMDHRDTSLKEMDAAPNFRMGHGDGDFFVSGKIAVGDDGSVRAANIDKFQKALNDAGFGHIRLDRNLENNTVYARTDSEGDMGTLAKVFDAMHAAGILEKGSTSSGAAEAVLAQTGILSSGLKRALEISRSVLGQLGEGMDEDTRKLITDRNMELHRAFMDMLPPSSINRVMARNKGVQGYSGDALQNYKQRATAFARALAGQATSPKIAASIARMAADIKATNNRSSGATEAIRLGLHNAIKELNLREAQVVAAAPSNIISAVRGLTSMFEIGMSPPYVAMLTGQNFTLTLPRLAAQAGVGYLRAAKAMAQAATVATKVTRIVLTGSEGSTFGLRYKELIDGGVPQKWVDHIMKQSAMGSYTHASYTKNMRGEHADTTSTIGKAANWASTMGLTAEMHPRLIATIAAQILHEQGLGNRKMDVHDFAHSMVENSQLPWNPSFNARQTTSKGFLGKAGPLFNQFMGFQIGLTDLLYRDAARAFGRGDPAQTAEARKFLAGHLAAVTILSGTLGLPMMGPLAAVFDRLADWATNKDDWDITSAYRNFLADTFGKNAGEVIARGTPRAAGVDLEHWGDSTIVPGSSAIMHLFEKRKLEDAEKDWFKGAAGSAGGTMMNMALAARDISNGDYLRGASKFMPEILRGPAEASQLLMYGYRDKAGRKLPISAGTKQVLMTAIGLDPANEAEYNEMARTVSGEQTLAQQRSGNIMQHLSQAQMRGDNTNFQYWVNQSNQFQHDHPNQPPPIAELTRYLGQGYREQSIAESMGLPLATRLGNFTARGMVHYGNLPSR